MSEQERYMRRALELARGPAHTSPNPRVGAVIVRDGEVLSEGAHEGAGTRHAEAVALDGVDASGATVYVNLEPCTHHGRMPPCAPALIEAGVARVVVAIEDPDERVAGAGIAQLRDAGIEVEVGVLADEAEHINAPFLHHRRTGRAYLTVKLGLSIDGRLGAPDGSARWITGPRGAPARARSPSRGGCRPRGGRNRPRRRPASRRTGRRGRQTAHPASCSTPRAGSRRSPSCSPSTAA